MPQTSHQIFLTVALFCIGVLAVALYLQTYHHLPPCPLCIVQRMLYLLIAAVALVAWLQRPQAKARRLYATAMAVLALGGAAVALRHIWIIRHPEQAAGCGISPLENFLNGLPLANWWPTMFEAYGDCADSLQPILGLTIPEWSLIAFCLLTLTALYQGLRKS